MLTSRVAVEIIEIRAQGLDGVEAGYAGVQRAQTATAKSTREADDAMRRAEAGFTGSEKAAGSAERAFTKTGASLVTLDAALSLAERGLHALQRGFDALRAPVGLAIDFEKGVAQIRTLGADLAADFDAQLREAAKRLPQTAGDLTRATYDAISAGISGANVIAFIESASNAAVAGSTDLTAAVRALTTGVNAFTENAGDASKVSDQLFAIVRQGVTDFSQLAATDLDASLATLGVKLAEVGGATVVLTKRGQSTSMALTTLRNVVASIATPTAEAAKEYQRLGVEVGVAALQERGLTAVLADIAKATGGQASELAKLTDNQEAQRGLLVLAGAANREYAASVDAVRNSTGETARAAQEMAQTTAGAQQRFASLVESMQMQLGEALLPTVNALLADLTAWIEANGAEMAQTIAEVVKQMVALGRWAAEHGEAILRIVAGLFVADRVSKWTEALVGAVSAVKGVGAALGGLNGAVFSAQGLGGAFSAALRSNAFIGLAVGAAISLGALVADRMHEAMVARFRDAEAAARASVDTRETRAGAFQSEVLTAAGDENLRRVLDARGADGLREFAAKQRDELLKASADLAEPVRRLAQDMLAAQREAAALLERERVAGHVPTTITTLDQYAALNEDQRARASADLGAATARYQALQAEMTRANAEAAAFAQAAEGLAGRVDALVADAPAPAPKMRSVADPKDVKLREEMERAAREALLLAEAYDEGERRLIAFDLLAERTLREARRVGADIGLIQRHLAQQRSDLVAELAQDTDAILADLGSDGRRIGDAVLANEQRFAEDLARARAANLRAVGASEADILALELSELKQQHAAKLAEYEGFGKDLDALRAEQALAEAAHAAKIEAARTAADQRLRDDRGFLTSPTASASRFASLGSEREQGLRDMAARRERAREARVASEKAERDLARALSTQARREADADAAAHTTAAAAGRSDEAARAVAERQRDLKQAEAELRAARRPAGEAVAATAAAAAQGLAGVTTTLGGLADADTMAAELERLREHHAEVLAEYRRQNLDATALRAEFFAAEQSMATRAESAFYASVVATGQAGIATLAALAKQAGASAKQVGILEAASLAATAIQELIFAKRDGALALTHAVPGPLFSPLSAAGYGLSAAAHAATAVAAGAQAVGLGGSGGQGGRGAGAGAALPPLPTPAAALPEPERREARPIEVYIQGAHVVADRSSARTLGAVLGEYVMRSIGQDTGSRGAAQIPARAFEGV